MTSGAKFEQINMEFLSATFPKMQNIRPGRWHIVKLGNRNAIKTSSFVQYEHLEYLTRLLTYNRQLAASMGNDYMVAPDVVVYRETATDEELNDPERCKFILRKLYILFWNNSLYEKQGSSCTENVNCCFYNAEKPTSKNLSMGACFCVHLTYRLIVRFTQKESNEIVHNAGFMKNTEKSL